MMSDNDILVMTYGTLKRGHYNYPYMQAANGEFVDEVVSAESKYQMVGVGTAFPGIIAGDKQFSGELFKVPVEGIINVLDFLEGYPVMYDRGFITVKSLNTNKEYSALVYFLTKSFIHSTNLVTQTPQLKFDNNVYSWE